MLSGVLINGFLESANEIANKPSSEQGEPETEQATKSADQSGAPQKSANSKIQRSPVSVEGYKLEIVETRRVKKLGVDLYGEASPYHSYYVIYVDVTNKTSEMKSVPGGFELEDKNNYRFEGSGVGSTYADKEEVDAHAITDSIEPGETIRSVMAFEIPDRARELKLVWKSGLFGSGAEYAKIPLTGYRR